MRPLTVSGLLFLVACGEASRQAAPVVAQAPTRPPAAAAQDPAASRRTAIVTASERVAPAVVSVNVVRRERQVGGGTWSLFFAPREFERTVQGLGSGFIVDLDGLVITNQHVVAGAEQIVVTTRDGSDYPATLLGEDPLTDIAVLRIDGADLPTVPLGSARSLVIGE